MENILVILPVILSFSILAVPSRLRYYCTLFISLFIVILTSIPALEVIFSKGCTPQIFYLVTLLGSLHLTVDGLSAFFILVTNFTVLTGLLYSKGYLVSYRSLKSPAQLSLHNFSYTWLHLSMLGVLMLRDGIPFLIAWELMAVSSFMLILFDAEKRATLKTAVNYLIQMHIGLVFLVIAFLLCAADTGRMSFDALTVYFSHHSNTGLFTLFFAGFAIKAGFIPFHTWLPEAHPAAPSHVSGVMSGVMIKMGIYGIVRVLTNVQSDLVTIGLIVLSVSAVSGVLGVLMAIVQHDLKKLLAYHSIENIGIIGIGIGLGAIGLGIHNPMLVMLGFTGGLLHVLNHSLFKSLLFFSAGSVYQSCQTRNLEELGGLVKKMPVTAGLFLTGSIAICGLPPLNGFISEILIYIGLFTGLSAGSVYQSVYMLLAIISLVLIGGLAIYCFTKAFGVIFLGSPRSASHTAVAEAGKGMLAPQLVISGVILMIGFFPLIFLQPLAGIISMQFQLSVVPGWSSITESLSMIGSMGFLLTGISLLLFYIRYRVLKTRIVREGPTWGCGYTAATSRMQYTGTSYADAVSGLAEPILKTKTQVSLIGEEEIFPGEGSFSTHTEDVFRLGLNRLIDFLMLVLKKLARLQTGNIQHYILYAFIFMILIFVLLYLKIL
ncbi:MAG: proton-conducting transporter membrane subunit [Bacteroidetes bacterium]|nr:proton-conducting transporter membrane subunit [Bacteroidota bacterium]